MTTYSPKPRGIVPAPEAASPRYARPDPTPEPAPVRPDLIRARAYDLFLARTRLGIAGDDVTDWLQAERELNAAPPRSIVAEIKARVRGETLLHAGPD